MHLSTNKERKLTCAQDKLIQLQFWLHCKCRLSCVFCHQYFLLLQKCGFQISLWFCLVTLKVSSKSKEWIREARTTPLTLFEITCKCEIIQQIRMNHICQVEAALCIVGINVCFSIVKYRINAFSK